MERFDDAGIIKGRGDLGGCRRKFRHQILAQARYFKKITAVIGPDRKRLDFNLRNQVAAPGR
jgi:hypothetical protein